MKRSVLRALLSGAYGLAWLAARPVLCRHKRLQEGFPQRLVPDGWPGSALGMETGDGSASSHTRSDIWLQAASGGEAYLVWELLAHLAVLCEKQGTPEPLRVLATTWTRQGLDILQDMSGKLHEKHPWLSVRSAFFPLDAPKLMEKALDQVRPRVVGLLETELWPGLMLACEKRHVPMLILNGRMTDKSLRGYLKLEAAIPGFWESIAPKHVCAISKADAGRFARIFGGDRVEAVPNIKFDRATATAIPAVSDPLLKLLPPELHARQTVLLASVREQEEPALLSVIQTLHAHDAPTIVIAPRHMHRVKPWQALLSGAKLPAVMRSKQEGTIPAGSIVIWDTFGELGQLTSLRTPFSSAAASPPSAARISSNHWHSAGFPAAAFIWTTSHGRWNLPAKPSRTPSKPSAFSKPGKTPRPSQHCCNSSSPYRRRMTPCGNASSTGSHPVSAARPAARRDYWMK